MGRFTMARPRSVLPEAFGTAKRLTGQRQLGHRDLYIYIYDSMFISHIYIYITYIYIYPHRIHPKSAENTLAQ